MSPMRRIGAWAAGVLAVAAVVAGVVAGLAHVRHTAAAAQIGAVIGGAVVCLALLVWAWGFGLFGGKVVPLSRPMRRR